MVFHVMVKENVHATVISMVKRVANAKKVFTISPHVKNAIVIRLVWQQNGMAAVRFRLVNYANAKNV